MIHDLELLDEIFWMFWYLTCALGVVLALVGFVFWLKERMNR